jgi:hypothetical protein
MEKPRSPRPKLISPSVRGKELKILGWTSSPKDMNPMIANTNEINHDRETAIPVA